MKLEFKKALVPICFFYFALFFSFNLVFPYFTLQLRTLGLTLDDAALIGGITPIAAFAFAPLLGYLGDKLGFKAVLICSLMGSLVSSGALPFVPTYRSLQPQAAVVNFNSSNDPPWSSVQWVGEYNRCEAGFLVVVGVHCGDSDWTGRLDLTNECSGNEEGQCGEIATCVHKCENPESFAPLNFTIQHCRIDLENGRGNQEEGSHSLTFWIYFAIRTVLNTFMNASFNISDAAAATKAKKEGAAYSSIMFFGTIAGIITPNVIGPILDNVNLNPSSHDCLTGIDITPTDYRIPFAIADSAFLAMAIFIFFFIDIEVESPAKKMTFKQEFSWVWKAPVLTFYVLMFFFGIFAGVGSTFVFPFAVEELGASMSFLGYCMTGFNVTSLLILPCVPFLHKKLGVVNCIVLGVIIEASVDVVFYFCEASDSPPYILIFTNCLDGMGMNILWVSIMQYMTSLAPPALTATAISIMATIIWVLGKGAGSMLAGLLYNKFGMRGMFLVVGVGLIAIAICYLFLYHVALKRGEKMNETTGEKKEDNEEEQFPEWHWSTRL